MFNQTIDVISRVTAVYFFILIAIRVAGKNEMSQVSVADFVLILLVSNAVQNSMIGPYNSLSAGLIAASTLFVINYILKKYLYKIPFIKKTFEGEALLLIYNGKVQLNHLKKAELSVSELEMLVRENGIESIKKVKQCIQEIDGKISILSY
jgi:uncharacterized membrane protein YcaP (DUF421 family)